MDFNTSLKAYNTFGVEARALGLSKIRSSVELLKVFETLKHEEKKFLILGGGSNVLFTQDFEGWVIKNEIFGKSCVKDLGEELLLEVGAGENWHETVLWTLEQGYFGLENLALIPGCVGAAPIQNIGAYGVEVKDLIFQVEGYDLDGNQKVFSREECEFGYRDSHFKRNCLDQFMITKVVFKLSKIPNLKLSYGAIEQELDEMKVQQPQPKDVAEAVIRIRRSKLPDPEKIGNGGSFFKNPVINKDLFNQIKANYPKLPHYEVANADQVKVPAGWLIEQAGWKGKSLGKAAVHDKQALVLVNLGEAKGEDVLRLSREIQASVDEKFNVSLEPEVRFI